MARLAKRMAIRAACRCLSRIYLCHTTQPVGNGARPQMVQGQNAITQADMFKKEVQCTGIILAKLDGTAKGGAIFQIKQKLGLPVKFIGVGETLDDLEPFDPQTYVEALFSE